MYNANFFCETLEKGRIFRSKQRLRAWERERMKGRKKNEHVFTFILIHRFLGQFASFHVYSIGKLFITYISPNSPHSAVSSPVQTRHTPIYIITWHWFFCSCLEPEKNHTNFPDGKTIFLCVCAMQMRDKCLIGVNRSLSIFERRKNRLRICVLCGPIKTQNWSKIRENFHITNAIHKKLFFSFDTKLFNNMSYFRDLPIPFLYISFHIECLLWFLFSHGKICEMKSNFHFPRKREPKPFLLLKTRQAKNTRSFRPHARRIFVQTARIYEYIYVYFNDRYSNEEWIHWSSQLVIIYSYASFQQQNASETNRRKMKRNVPVKYKWKVMCKY